MTLIRDGVIRAPLLLCFSHLRWNFVFQRPQHLMTRWARHLPVVFWEEPIELAAGAAPWLDIRHAGANLRVAVPRLPPNMPEAARRVALRRLLDGLLAGQPEPVVRWYYTPMMLAFSHHVPASCVVYDCMDELSGFRFAPPDLPRLENQLLDEADLVFTGGWSLYEAKQARHPEVHAFPSSVDAAHFAAARCATKDPPDQHGLGRPRLGFYGVIDERMDLSLVATLAEARPDWTLVMLGPTAKIDPAHLPRRPNIVWLGAKTYDELPSYIAGWDVALMPFAINEATRYISPTKTPEYLAAGLPVVSTPIVDVVRQYGDLDALRIARTPAGFIAGCEAALRLRRGASLAWRDQADSLLADSSWDLLHTRMRNHVAEHAHPLTTPAEAAE